MKTYLALLSMVLCIPMNAEDIEVLYRNTSRLMSNLYSDRGFDAKEEQQRLKRSLTVYEGFKEREVAVPSAFYKLIDGLARLPVRDYTHLSKFGDKVESMLPIKRINPKRSDTRSSSLYPALAYLPNFVASLKDQNPEEEKIKYVLKKRDLAVFLLMQLQLLKRQPFSHETTSILEAVVSAGNDSQDYMLRLWTIDYLGGLASQDHYQKVKGEKWMKQEANISGKLSPGTLKKVASLRHDSWTMEHDVLLKTMPNHPLLKKVLEHFLADKDRAYNKVLTWALRMHLDGSAELPFPEKAFGEFVQRPSVPVLLTIARLDGRLLSYFDKIRSPFHFAGTYKIDVRARRLYFDLLDRLILLKRKKTLRPLIPQKRNR